MRILKEMTGMWDYFEVRCKGNSQESMRMTSAKTPSNDGDCGILHGSNLGPAHMHDSCVPWSTVGLLAVDQVLFLMLMLWLVLGKLLLILGLLFQP